MVKKQFDQSNTQAVKRLRRPKAKRIGSAVTQYLLLHKHQIGLQQGSDGASVLSVDSQNGHLPSPVDDILSQPKDAKKGIDLKEKGVLLLRSCGKVLGYGSKYIFTWPSLWLTLLVACSTTGVMALRWLLTMPPPVNCEQPATLSNDRQQLYCAQKNAESRNLEDLVAAIALVEAWPDDHPLKSQGGKLVGEWSVKIMDLARQKFVEGDLEQAEALIQKIPASSPVYAAIQDEVATWQGNWADGKTLYDQAQAALKKQDWRQAENYARNLLELENVYWRSTRYSQLKQQISTEKQAWDKLKEARYNAGFKTVADLAFGIDQARQIPPQTYVGEAAKQDIVKWSRDLLQIAQKLWQENDFDSAVRAANWVPRNNSALYRESRDLITLIAAQKLMKQQNSANDRLAQVFAFSEAIAAMGNIEPSSPLHKEVQGFQTKANEQIQDLLQLQLATVTASFNHPWALKLAIDQAQMVTISRPRRIDGQTLVAQWTKEIQLIEDRVYVAQAQQIAAPGSIEAYQAAIALASQVAQGRPMRIEAQTLIAGWNKQIQRIEDQPILDQALALAKADKLPEAITTAKKITADRALYKEAQVEIGKWQSTLEIAQDQPILDQATALAAQGSLGLAIDTAYQISYGRALYPQAQEAIAQWSGQLEAIRAEQEALRRASYQPPAPVYQEPPPPRYQEPAPTYYQEPAPTYYEEPAPVYYEEPAPVYYEEPAPVYQEPAPTYYEEPAPVYQEPAPTYYEEPAPVYQEPAPVYQEAAPVYQEPAASQQSYNDTPAIDGIE